MKYDSGRFEGGYRLMHIHNTKRYLFLVQAVLILIFAAYMVYAGGGLSLKPFFLGINSFLYFVLLMVLLILAESYIRTALAWAVVWLVLLLVFTLPLLPGVVKDTTQSEGRLTAVSSSVPAHFVISNTDIIGLTEISSIHVTALGEVDVFVLTEYNYLLFKDDGAGVLGGYRVNVNDYLAAPDLTIDFPDMPHNRFYVLFYSLNDAPADIEYTIEREVSRTLMDYMPLMSIIFVAVNGVAAVYMMLMNRRYKAGIYR